MGVGKRVGVGDGLGVGVGVVGIGGRVGIGGSVGKGGIPGGFGGGKGTGSTWNAKTGEINIKSRRTAMEAREIFLIIPMTVGRTNIAVKLKNFVLPPGAVSNL